jgi:hypothetical protein
MSRALGKKNIRFSELLKWVVITWLIFDEIQNSKSLNICNFFVEMAKLL